MYNIYSEKKKYFLTINNVFSKYLFLFGKNKYVEILEKIYRDQIKLVAIIS